MIDDRLTRMFYKQLELQKLLGCDPREKRGDARIVWFKDMYISTIAELQESLNEVGWKPWATSRHLNEDKAFGELRDAWQFLTNMMFTVYQISPDELAQRLEDALDEKIKINVERHNTGYDGVSTKCPSCRRALEEVSLTEIKKDNGVTELVFCQCGAPIDLRVAAPFLIE